MSQQTCSMRELCIRLLALAVAGRAQQGHLQLQPVQDGQQQQEQQEQGQRQEQGQQPDGQQRRSLSPEVRVYVGVEAVAERLRESLALAKRMANSKLLPKDLDSTSQVRPSPPPTQLWTDVCWQWMACKAVPVACLNLHIPSVHELRMRRT